jgi:catechol 2,3-dioxygenase-like lactoylglutathione lyase family enzyme
MSDLLIHLTENCCAGDIGGSFRHGRGNTEENCMKRFHVHVAVEDLETSIQFYAALFGAEPAVRKQDYAKWMIEDPRVNFAISTRSSVGGINHLGVQVESADELAQMRGRMEQAARPYVEEPETACCYAKSDKYWIADPQGIAWETFHTLEAVPVFGTDAGEESQSDVCCIPIKIEMSAAAPATQCCVPSMAPGANTVACCK